MKMAETQFQVLSSFCHSHCFYTIKKLLEFSRNTCIPLSWPNSIAVVMVQVGVDEKTVIDWFTFVCDVYLLAQPS